MIKNLKYMDIEYTDNDLEYINYLCSEIDNKSEEIVNFFELKEFGEIPNIKLFNSLDEFRKFYEETFKRGPRDGVGGFARNNNVYTLSLSEYKKCRGHENATIDSLIKLIIHEFIHIVHLKRNNNLSQIWLLEGAATCLSNQKYNETEIRGSLDDFINKKCFYSDYKLMFEYVLNTYGKEYILKLIDDKELLDNDTNRLFEEAKLNFDSKKVR